MLFTIRTFYMNILCHYNSITLITSSRMGFNWLYTSWNDNEYILFLIIVILFFIIIDFKLLKRKAPFTDATSTTNQATTTSNQATTTTNQATTTTNQATTTTNQATSTTNQATSTTNQATTTSNQATTTSYQAPTATNPANNLFVTDEEKNKWRRAWGQLDGNEETLSYTSNATVRNDILQLDSTLYTPNFPSSNIAANIANYAQPGNWATIDDLGKSMTDTLGGINSNLGYTLLTEQLGTFKPNYNNPNVYDNTQNYKTGLNPTTLSGASLQGAGGSYQQVGKSPIFMQKDFAGVANIFAPNIYVSNAPLSDSGVPDISFTNGDGNTYSV